MSDDNNELSDEEYDALLRDLEGRSGSAGEGSEGGGAGEDIGDIDAFLSELDADAESKSTGQTTTAEPDDDLAGEFAALEEKGELTAAPKAKKKQKKKKKKKKQENEAGESAQKDSSRGKKQVALKVAKTVFWFSPAVVLWWILGVYLGQWVAAGWLIALVSTMIVFSMPVVLKKIAKRGSYRPWVFGASLVATIALVAPMPNTAGENVASYGHWPSTVIAEVVGAQSDAGIVTAHAAAAGWLGDQIAPEDLSQWEPRQLGTIFPLGMQWPPDEDMIPILEEGIEAQQQQEVDGEPDEAVPDEEMGEELEESGGDEVTDDDTVE